jgi:translation initiation factor 2-alpha kinase 4
MLFSGTKEPLWTSYIAEPIDTAFDPSFVKSTLPTICVQVVDFANKFYSTVQGSKKIDSLTGEISRLKDLNSQHVANVLAVKREKSPRGWERILVFVERPPDGTKLGKWLPQDGYEEDMARVGRRI